MVKIRITKPFRLTNKDGTISDYQPGDHEFPDGSEDHFFIKAHSDKAEDAKPGLGTAAHVEKMRMVAEARRKAVEEADELVREAEEAHMSTEEQKARQAGAAAGMQLPKPAGSVKGGPNVEGAAREISPGMKGLPDRDAAVGNLTEVGRTPIADEASTVLDDEDGEDDTGDDDEAVVSAKREAAASGSRVSSDTSTNTSGPVKRRAIIDPAKTE